MVQLKCIILLTLITMQIAIEARTFNSKWDYKKVIIKKNVLTEQPRKCDELPAPVLNDILGAAFNSRYMSIDPPQIEPTSVSSNAAGKRGAQDFKPFYVDDTYAMELSDKPAWEVVAHVAEEVESEPSKRSLQENPLIASLQQNNTSRIQRSNGRRRNDGTQQQQQIKRPWECEAKIKWLDLGYDYYPRYLRTVECTRHACFYGHFTCTPRSFTVKILRRRRGECVQTKNSIGIDGLPGDLRELWIWEERAVNFCCDCAAR